MRPRVVRVIAQKELLESFRDRKTLFLMIFLPILLYPVLILVVTQVVMLQQTKLAQETSTVLYRNAPPSHPLVRFLEDDERLEVIAGGADTEESLGEEGVALVLDLAQWPEGVVESTLQAHLAYESVDDSSRQAADRVEEDLRAFAEHERRARLERAGIDPDSFASVLDPVAWELEDNSPPAQRGGYALGSFLPILVIATVLLGAFYPAIDLTAGEKERGSIQTLFTAPVTPLEIVAGKYVAVLVIALVSGMANLVGMLLLFSQNLFMRGDDALAGVDFSIGADAALALFVVIVLIAAFFSALLLTVAVLARSYKEGQNYITPVYMASFMPAIVAQLPGIELTPQLALVPAVNVTLLMKEVLIHGVSIESLFLVVASTLVFTALVLVLAGKLFAQEAVVLGERGNLRLLDRRRPGEPDRRPRLGEGLAWYGVTFVALFYLGSWAQSQHLEWGLVFTLWGLLLVPTLLLTRYLRLDLVATFNLRTPRPRALVAALLLGASAWIVVAWVNHLVDQHVLHMPPEIAEQMEALLPAVDSPTAWIVMLLVVAISPAICEEAVFRGFLFSSLRNRVGPIALVVTTAVLFGVFHLSIYRLLGTTMLGLVMGLLVYKSGSIWTSVVFHALSNGLVIALSVVLADELFAGGTVPLWLLGLGAAGTATGLALLFSLSSPWRRPAPEAT